MLYFDKVVTVVHLQLQVLVSQLPFSWQYKDRILVVTVDLMFLNYSVFVGDLFVILQIVYLSAFGIVLHFAVCCYRQGWKNLGF